MEPIPVTATATVMIAARPGAKPAPHVVTAEYASELIDALIDARVTCLAGQAALDTVRAERAAAKAAPAAGVGDDSISGDVQAARRDTWVKDAPAGDAVSALLPGAAEAEAARRDDAWMDRSPRPCEWHGGTGKSGGQCPECRREVGERRADSETAGGEAAVFCGARYWDGQEGAECGEPAGHDGPHGDGYDDDTTAGELAAAEIDEARSRERRSDSAISAEAGMAVPPPDAELAVAACGAERDGRYCVLPPHGNGGHDADGWRWYDEPQSVIPLTTRGFIATGSPVLRDAWIGSRA